MKYINTIILLIGLIAYVYGQKASSCYKPESYSRIGDKGAISLLPEKKMVCSKQGLTMDLCETMEIKLIEFRFYPSFKINGTISITFSTEDESEFATYNAEIIDSVKGPSQFFHVPENNILSKTKKINIIYPESECNRISDDNKTIFMAFIGRVTEDDDIDSLPKIVTDKDYADDEMDKYCNNEVDTLPLNFLVPEKFRNNLIIDIEQINKRSDDFMTKFGMAVKLFMKQKTQDDIDNECRGYMYIMQFNRCDIARTKHADFERRFDYEFKSLPKYLLDVVQKIQPDTLPATLTSCLRDLVVVNSSE